MSQDIVWSFTPVTLMSIFFGTSVVSFEKLSRNKICATYSICLFCFLIITSALVFGCYIYEAVRSNMYENLISITASILFRITALHQLWKCFNQYNQIIRMFENIQSIDSKLKSLGRVVEHQKWRLYSIVAVAANGTLFVLLCTFMGVIRFLDNSVLTYVIHSNFLHFNGTIWATMTNFYLLVLTVHQRMSLLDACIIDLVYSPRSLITSVLPPVENPVPQCSSWDSQNGRLKLINKACKELYTVLGLINDYFNPYLAYSTGSLVLLFVHGSFWYNTSTNLGHFIGTLIFIGSLATHIIASLTSCAVLEFGIKKFRLTMYTASELIEDRNTKEALNRMHRRLIHEETGISCGIFDWNLSLIPVIINLGSTFYFAVMSK